MTTYASADEIVEEVTTKMARDLDLFLVGEVEFWHVRRAIHDKGTCIHRAVTRGDVGEIRTHIAAEAVKLVASDAIVRLEQVLAHSRLIRHRFEVCGFGAHRVDVGRVEEENDKERAKN